MSNQNSNIFENLSLDEQKIMDWLIANSTENQYDYEIQNPITNLKLNCHPYTIFQSLLFDQRVNIVSADGEKIQSPIFRQAEYTIDQKCVMKITSELLPIFLSLKN